MHRLNPHLQFLSHYYKYYSFSAPKISYRCFKLFSSSVSCNNPANDKTPYWLQSVSTGCNVNMVFLWATRYYFLLTNHSVHTIKGTEQNLIKILSTGSLKTLKPLILLEFQTSSIYSHSTNPIIWDCIFYVFTDKLFANLLMFHLLFLAAQFLSIKIVSQKAEKCNHIPRLFQITSHFSLILFFDMF